MRITVYGTPGPQGSKRHVGNGRMIESSKLVAPWREAVKQAALAVRGVGQVEPPTASFVGPVTVTMAFTVKKPASAPKRTTTWPCKKPDLDKLVRSTADALSDAGVWLDDAQVTELVASKCYPTEGHLSLSVPGVDIFIRSIGANT